MIEGVGIALTGLRGASEDLYRSHQRIAEGEINAEAIVESKVAELDYKAQLVNLASALETEEAILDILA